MIINDSIKINESYKLDVSGIEVSPEPFNYEGFHGVTLEGTTPQSKRNLDNRGFLNSLEKLLGYVIQTSGFNGVARVNIKNKNFKDAYNDIKTKLEDQLSESIEADPDKELDENPTFLDRMRNSVSGDTFNVFSGSKNYKVTNIGGGRFKVIGGKGWDKPTDAYLKKISNDSNEVSKDALVNFIKMINKKMGYRESMED